MIIGILSAVLIVSIILFGLSVLAVHNWFRLSNTNFEYVRNIVFVAFTGIIAVGSAILLIIKIAKII